MIRKSVARRCKLQNMMFLSKEHPYVSKQRIYLISVSAFSGRLFVMGRQSALDCLPCCLFLIFQSSLQILFPGGTITLPFSVYLWRRVTGVYTGYYLREDGAYTISHYIIKEGGA